MLERYSLTGGRKMNRYIELGVPWKQLRWANFAPSNSVKLSLLESELKNEKPLTGRPLRLARYGSPTTYQYYA